MKGYIRYSVVNIVVDSIVYPIESTTEYPMNNNCITIESLTRKEKGRDNLTTVLQKVKVTLPGLFHN